MTALSAEALSMIGANIRAERVRRNMTQEALAGRTGLAVTQLARMERGETDSGVTKYLRVAAGIGVPMTDLFWNVTVELDEPAR